MKTTAGRPGEKTALRADRAPGKGTGGMEKSMERIFRTIQEYQMIRPGMRVVAGISGGADSVCLLFALRAYQARCPFELLAVHVEHGIRGEESLEDARFVQELCRKWGVACQVEHCDAPLEARKRRLSLEEAGRLLRYGIFEQIRCAQGADAIAVAHNENDQAETVLWNLARGSGLRGLGGMRPVQGRIIRPLLFVPRSEIEGILREEGIGYRTDRTNLEADCTRNRLRLEVLPYFEEQLNARASEHIAGAALRLRQAQEFVSRQTQEAKKRCVERRGDEVALKLEAFFSEDPYLQGELLDECLRLCGGPRDVGAVHFSMLRELAGMPCGKQISLPGGIVAVREAGGLLFRKAQPDEPGKRSEECIPLPFAFGGIVKAGKMEVRVDRFPRELVPTEEILSEKKYTKWLSCDTIKSNVCLRRRRPGDYLIVNAQGGRKKLKDYLIDQKIPRGERGSLWLFADGSHVLWVVGYRISEAAKVTEGTKEVMRITVAAKPREDGSAGEDFFHKIRTEEGFV